MATTSVPWARPSAFGLVAPPPLRVSRRPGAPVRAFRRSDLDGFARRVASSEALRDAWRSANNGIEQVVFEARRAAKRLDRRYDLFRRFDSAARAASNWARKIDQELGIGRRWRSFSVDFSRNWPRYRRELNDFLQTPLGRGLATIFFLWFALSGWLFRFFILATWVLPFVAPLLIETLANNFAIQKGLQTLLMNAQVRGTTGISSDSGSLREPLLQVQTSKAKHVESQRSSMYGSANLLQLMTFSWLNPLFAMGRRKPLEQNEIPDVDKNSSAEFVSHSFDSCLNNVKERYGLRTSSIYRAIFAFIRKKAAINASFAVVAAGASYVGPSLIVNFVKFLGEERQHGLRSGYVLALTFLGAKVVESVCQRQWNFGAQQLAMCVRSALISHLYKKGLELSSESRQSHTSGEIINYISVDIQRITDLMWHLNIIWMLPVQISLAIYVLHKNLGVGSFAGLAATTVVMACNIPITRAQKRFQSRIMKAKDERMKATAEVLRNMKILKLQAWDIQYLHKLEALRNTEYNWLWTYERVQLISSFIFWGAPMFISAATFGTCILIGIPLTTGRVLSALATFRMLQDPIFTIPDLLSVLAQGKVSADRIAKYLQEDEMKSDVVEIVPRTETEIDVEIDHGIFCWNKDSIYPTLENIQLKVHRGMKVAICGTVGSGKSSLLSCILGELQKLEGKVKISGSKAYVSQSPWIISGNVMFIFGNLLSEKRMKDS
ncbi:ABC transporter transmembrane region [Musa troglodytarum]|uniref:ABC transporter transmembrane region n=1 Tax=Musa troglodytarum TaxID=320322 RepID=A0A9E7K3Z1_9LILI|nr:ABC transporter transmembrane region [Musa troglodytarum]